MRSGLHQAFVAVATTVLVVGASSRACAATPREIFARVRPAVVRVVCGRHSGSGFVWRRADRVITALHVARCRETLAVVSGDGHRVSARVTRASASLDLAELALVRPLSLAPLRPTTPRPRPGVQTVGQQVCLVGYPLAGLRSADGSRPLLGAHLACGRVGAVNDSEIVFDAPVNRGDSGAPLFDSRGRLLAVVLKRRVGGARGIAVGRSREALALLLAEPRGRYKKPRLALGIATGYSLRARSDGALAHGPQLSLRLSPRPSLELSFVAGLSFFELDEAVSVRSVDLALGLQWRWRLILAGRAVELGLGAFGGAAIRSRRRELLVLDAEDGCPERPERCSIRRSETRALPTSVAALLRPLLSLRSGFLELQLRCDVALPEGVVGVGANILLSL